MATNETDAVTWVVVCTSCQDVVQEGTGTPPASVDALLGGAPNAAKRHVLEGGEAQHRLELRRRGRLTESVVAVRAGIEF